MELVLLLLVLMVLFICWCVANTTDGKLNVELRDGRKFLRLGCGAIVRKLDASDIDQLLRRCLTPNLGGLRKGDVVVFCYHDCVHCNHLTGCDKSFVVRRVAVGAEVDRGGVSVSNDEAAEMYWVSPGIDDADHVPIAIGPVARAFLLHEKSQMRVVIPPMADCDEKRNKCGCGGDGGGDRPDGVAPSAEEVQQEVFHGSNYTKKEDE